MLAKTYSESFRKLFLSVLMSSNNLLKEVYAETSLSMKSVQMQIHGDTVPSIAKLCESKLSLKYLSYLIVLEDHKGFTCNSQVGSEKTGRRIDDQWISTRARTKV